MSSLKWQVHFVHFQEKCLSNTQGWKTTVCQFFSSKRYVPIKKQLVQLITQTGAHDFPLGKHWTSIFSRNILGILSIWVHEYRQIRNRGSGFNKMNHATVSPKTLLRGAGWFLLQARGMKNPTTQSQFAATARTRATASASPPTTAFASFTANVDEVKKGK